MGQKGILKSEQGVRGGYFLSKSLDEVSFLEITETVLGRLEVAKCISGPLGCEIAGTCNIKTPMQKINTKLRNFYETLTVSEVLGAGPNNEVLKSMQLLDCSTTPTIQS
jgi:DNA-binding IscR family transcriptional regulator